jgi:hypothetical protein
MLVFSTSAYSANLTLDFEQYAGTVNNFESLPAGTVLGYGFQVNSVLGTVGWLNGDGPAPVPVGTAVSMFIKGSSAGAIEFGRSDGQAFDLIGFHHAFGGAGDFDFTITALLAGGGTVAEVLSVTEVDFQYDTFTDSGLFNNIVSFSVSTDGTTAPLALSFFSSLKKERIRKRIYKTRDLAKADVFDYIESFYNRNRRHSHLGGVSPEAFECASK